MLRLQLLIYSLLISLTWGGIFITSTFDLDSKIQANILLLIIICPQGIILLKDSIEKNKSHTFFNNVVCASIPLQLFLLVVIFDSLTKDVYSSLQPIKYFFSLFIAILWSKKLWSIWYSTKSTPTTRVR